MNRAVELAETWRRNKRRGARRCGAVVALALLERRYLEGDLRIQSVPTTAQALAGAVIATREPGR
jgi:hypothetical protein